MTVTAAKAPLTLDGEDLKLLHIKIDDRQLEVFFPSFLDMSENG